MVKRTRSAKRKTTKAPLQLLSKNKVARVLQKMEISPLVFFKEYDAERRPGRTVVDMRAITAVKDYLKKPDIAALAKRLKVSKATASKTVTRVLESGAIKA